MSLILLVMIPFWTPFIIRTYAWISILASGGVANTIIENSGLGLKLNVLYTLQAVFIASIYVYLPFSVISIFNSLEKIDPSLEDAASDLGASPWYTFRRVTLPLTLAGIYVSIVFVFVPMLGMFITPALLGGANSLLIGGLQVSLFTTALNFAEGSALSFVVLCVGILFVALLGRLVDLDTLYAGGIGGTGGRAHKAARRSSPLLKSYAAASYIFLFGPIVVLVLFSFSSATSGTFPPPGYTLRWYVEAFSDPWLLVSLRNSLIIATAAGAISVSVAAPAAYAFVRFRFPGRQIFQQLLLIPMILPSIMLGIGLLVFFHWAGLKLSYATIVIGHVTIVLPYAFLILLSNQYGMDRSIEEAAADLGAAPRQTFLAVTLPLMKPALLAAFLFSFALSFDEFMMTFLLSSTTQTLPTYIWGLMRTIVSPSVNALATSILLATILLYIFISMRKMWTLRREYRRETR